MLGVVSGELDLISFLIPFHLCLVNLVCKLMGDCTISVIVSVAVSTMGSQIQLKFLGVVILAASVVAVVAVVVVIVILVVV